jgi:putative glutamine amidotransferase
VAHRVAVTYEEKKKVGPYADALLLVGLEPVLLSADEPWSLKGLDGLLITGGCDIDPKRYGQERVPETQEPNPSRDRMEIDLLDEALGRDLPVLAICRGLQLFNVYHGGTLIQHLPGDPHRPPKRPADPSMPMHEVSVAPDSKLAAAVGAGKHPVNSRHHQAVDKLGAHLRISAKSVKDGIVEGVERPDKEFAVGVQWHPEDQVRSDETQLKLFRAFADAVDRRVRQELG